MVKSVFSEKVEIRDSKIHKKGMFAIAPISKGEVAFIKGGHILKREQILSSGVINSYHPIDNQYFLGATNLEEEDGIKLFINHSCNPNCGIRGEITFVAIRDIQANEELTIDYAFLDNEDYSFECTCGEKSCRSLVTGRDWKRKEIQEKYFDYFAAYLKEEFSMVKNKEVMSVSEVVVNLAAEGFYMPAEYSEHKATWMLWPERTDIWRLGGKPAQRVFADIANTLSEFESVIVGVNQSQYENARNRLSERIRVIELSYDDAWIRDTGPTILVDMNGNSCGIDWFFNAWGGIGHAALGRWDLTGSYFPWKLDDLVARKVLEIEGLKRYRCPLILEGGAIHVDGKGTLFATKECILGRNPNMSLTQVEEILESYLGVRNIVWLEHGLYLEENNGHIDNLCCLADERTLLLNWCDDESDPQYPISVEAYETLTRAKNSAGESYTIIKVSQPPALTITDEEYSGVDSSDYAIPRLPKDLLPASYMNAYPCNGAILVPSFASPFDERPLDYDIAALKAFKAAFPERKVIQIPSRELLLGGGGIHCVLQQVPKRNN